MKKGKNNVNCSGVSRKEDYIFLSLYQGRIGMVEWLVKPEEKLEKVGLLLGGQQYFYVRTEW